MPDSLPVFLQARVTVSEYPEGVAPVFPPLYTSALVAPLPPRDKGIPIITLGRYGAVMRRHKPSDDAIVAMLLSARSIVRLALQDLGPVCIPGTKITLPGCVWPKQYLEALGRIIWTRGVDVEILLSNPGSIPGGLTPTEANYGNGWSCVDVASEIIKTIQRQFPNARETDLRRKVEENLRVCFIRNARGNTWDDGSNIGMHSKHFIVDDIAAYIGSQNLYICDLAEWGVVIDDGRQVKKMMNEYWKPLWEVSYLGTDVDVSAVMDGLDIDRSAPDPTKLSPEDRKRLETPNHRFSEFTPVHSHYYIKGDEE
jgi:phosphatidylserine/phosphatidylglycerophosphate/cardiolipin synthase-like enzyme